ncbi:MAG TPA: hypothetical protein VFV34_07125 [Blastocatellia bacterium]|nr:hypothetical protein [Blastocatellia bacterium]
MNKLILVPHARLSRLISLVVFGMCYILPGTAWAQAPTDAQTRKDVTGPKTVSVTLGKPGTVEWSGTYKKYMWTRSFTAKLRTETPDVFVIVKGYAAYDVIGGRYTFWRTFTTSNSYEGIPDPTPQEIQGLVEKFGRKEFIGAYAYQNAVGEIEALRLADEPKFEWHTPNSVSFDVLAVYAEKVSYTKVEKVERIHRIRLYRDGVKEAWARLMTTPGERKVLETKTYAEQQLRRMAGPSKP